MLALRNVYRCRTAVRLASPVVASMLAPRALLHVSVVLSAKPKGGKGSSPAPAGAAASGAGAAAGFAGVDIPALKAEMAKSVDWAKRELSKLRGGTATPQMLDHVMVEVHGEKTPLSGAGQVSLKNPTLFVVSPYDTANLVAITNAIRDAGLNLNPSHDDKVVKVPVPKPSKESRDASIKLASKIANDAKETVRRVRQDALDKLKKVDGLPKDDLHRQTKEVNELTTAVTDDLTKLADKKKTEIEAV